MAKDMGDMPLSPRFQSDTEGPDPGDSAPCSDERKLVLETLASSEKWEATGVDIDPRMLEGRKANRGFTMSVGSRSKAMTAEDVASGNVDAAGRSAKRAQTMPAPSTRRGDFVLSNESQTKLQEQQAVLAARYRRGSVTVVFTTITEDEFTKVWEDETTCHVHGAHTEGQSHGDDREWVFSKSTKKPDVRPIIACQKGSKGFKDTAPNQDNFSVTYYKNGWTLACVYDGHGPYGHFVSTRTVQTTPYFLAKSEHFPDNMEAALIESFEMSQKDVVAKSVEDGWDVQASGSTAVAACWKGNKIYTANCGDSRCVVGTVDKKAVVFETKDHKPNDPLEEARIVASGGEVRSQRYPDGWVNYRIFVKGEDYPGLCMARTLGDNSVKEHGVIATPEVASCEVNLAEQPFFILASDGVWEFIDSEFVIKAVAKKIPSDGPERTIQKLQREARKRWKQEEGDYCDDISSILVQLK